VTVCSAVEAAFAAFRFHDLRHEAAPRNVEAGYPMHVVSLWLGHTNLTTTARYLEADVAQLHPLNDRPGPSASNAPPRTDSSLTQAKKTG
jgi:integrase